MQEIEIKVDITVQCEKCGVELSADFDTRRSVLKVTPCEKCLSDEYDRGYDEAPETGAE